jgi:hypothetical protein
MYEYCNDPKTLRCSLGPIGILPKLHALSMTPEVSTEGL